MTSPDDDLVWTLGGREPRDPQRAARMVEPYSRLRDLRRESIREAQDFTKQEPEHQGNVMPWLLAFACITVAGVVAAFMGVI